MTENQQRLIFWLIGSILLLFIGYIVAKKNETFKNSFYWWSAVVFFSLTTSYAGLLFVLLMCGITYQPKEKKHY